MKLTNNEIRKLIKLGIKSYGLVVRTSPSGINVFDKDVESRLGNAFALVIKKTEREVLKKIKHSGAREGQDRE